MTAVRALPMEMFAPAANVPSSRDSAIRLPPASTTAITPPGDFTSSAFAFAAAMTRSAPSSVRVFFSAVWPNVTEPERSHTARNTILRKVITILFPYKIWSAGRRFLLEQRPALELWPELHHRGTEAGFAEIYFREGAPDHDLLDVLHVTGQHDFFLVARADERFGLEFIEQVDVSIGIDNLPVRVGRIGNHKVVRQRQNALAAPRAVGNGAFVGFGALELR